MSNSPLVKALGAGTVMQVVMVLLGQFAPSLREGMLYPVAGTLIGLVTGWLSGRDNPAAGLGKLATNGGLAGAGAGVLGSLVSTALGQVPLDNALIAGGSTLVSGAIGGILNQFLGKKA